MADSLQVHGVQISNQTRLGSGRATAATHVVFYVGNHGPFQKDFVAPDDTPAMIQAYIQQTVADLKAITERTY